MRRGRSTAQPTRLGRLGVIIFELDVVNGEEISEGLDPITGKAWDRALQIVGSLLGIQDDSLLLM